MAGKDIQHTVDLIEAWTLAYTAQRMGNEKYDTSQPQPCTCDGVEGCMGCMHKHIVLVAIALEHKGKIMHGICKAFCDYPTMAIARQAKDTMAFFTSIPQYTP